jgi:hypothetical protein
MNATRTNGMARHAMAVLVGLAAAAVFTLAACGGSSKAKPDAGPDFDAGGCYENPTTHAELIDACTTSAHVDKHPTLPLLLPDGGLPPLP